MFVLLLATTSGYFNGSLLQIRVTSAHWLNVRQADAITLVSLGRDRDGYGWLANLDFASVQSYLIKDEVCRVARPFSWLGYVHHASGRHPGHYLVFPSPLITLLLVTLLLKIGIAMLRSGRRVSDGLCASCGYNLCGTIKAGRSECPECGAAIDSERPETEAG